MSQIQNISQEAQFLINEICRGFLINFSSCLLRNYEKFVITNGDIDILIKKKDLKRALEFFKDYCLTHPSTISHSKIKNYEIKFNLSFPGNLMAKFHLQSEARLFGLVKIVDTDVILNSRVKFNDYFIPAPAYEAILLLFHANTRTARYLFSASQIKPKYKEKLKLLFDIHRDEINDLLVSHFGEHLGRKIISRLTNNKTFKLGMLKYRILLSLLKKKSIK
jgi:hypothetical protein